MFNEGYKKNKVVKLVDSRMGSQKTTKILEWMDRNTDKRYIYVTPLLSEICEQDGRVHKELTNIVLEVPSDKNQSKSDSLLAMLKNGDNIACTHSLYLSMTDNHFDELAHKGYTIVIDEEVNVINGFDKYSKFDLEWLITRGDISIDDSDGMVSWVGSRDSIQVGHKYNQFLEYCDAKALYAAKRSDTIMVSQLPIKLFECAREVIVLTYMFKGNVLDSFLKLKGFTVEPFTEIECQPISKKELRDLITIVPPSVKTEKYNLTSTWWKEADRSQINDVSNYIRTNAKSLGLSGHDVLWTVPKNRAVKTKGNSNKIYVKPRAYNISTVDKSPCFLAASVRATNDYAHKKAMFHCFNRFPLISVSSYLHDYGAPLDNKVFALSEMLQWLWRGCIRENKPMVVAIANKRMYSLFVEWLDSDE